MDKDEILSKHKQENRFGDEREKNIRIRRDAFSLGGVVVLGCFFMMLKIWKDQYPADIFALFACQGGLSCLYEWSQLRQKKHLVWGILLMVITALCVFIFCRHLLA